MQRNLLFSIIVPVYNRADLISNTLSSLLSSSYKDFEIIVVDDGSTDNTGEIVQSVTDARIKYFKKENGERGAARNFGAQRASGDYVNFFDSDDLAYPHRLDTAVDLINRVNPDVFVLNMDVTNQEGRIIRTGSKFKNINSQLIHGNLIDCSPVFVKREVALKFPFDENRELSGSEDYLLWLKLAARYPIHFSNKISSSLLCHPGRSVLSFNKDALIKRKLLMLKQALADPQITSYYEFSIKHLRSNTYSYIALHLAIDKYKKESFYYLRKAIQSDLSFLFSRRYLAIMYKMIF